MAEPKKLIRSAVLCVAVCSGHYPMVYNDLSQKPYRCPNWPPLACSLRVLLWRITISTGKFLAKSLTFRPISKERVLLRLPGRAETSQRRAVPKQALKNRRSHSRNTETEIYTWRGKDGEKGGETPQMSAGLDFHRHLKELGLQHAHLWDIPGNFTSLSAAFLLSVGVHVLRFPCVALPGDQNIGNVAIAWQ